MPRQPDLFSPNPSPRPRLVLVASADRDAADDLALRLRGHDTITYAAHSWDGCLRLATSVAPDLVLLDPALPRRLEGLLHAHPRTAAAKVVRLSDRSLHHGHERDPHPTRRAA